MRHTALPKALASFFALSLVAGCAIKPEPLTRDELAAYGDDKLARVASDQEAITRSISLYEAMARALKYNLDAKVEMAQTALKLREADLAEYKLLPSFVANSGFARRDNELATRSKDLTTGRTSATYSTSTDDGSFASDVTLSWNVLDFGLSYVRAQQLGDDALIAEEMRRKVANRVTEDVRTAYWRALTYQRLIARLRDLEGRAQRARAAARKLYSEGQTPPMLALAYERELVEIRREIEKVEGELVVAKDQLGALMNVPPGTRFSLVDDRVTLGSAITASAETMTRAALQNRPELHEVAYRTRINEKEAAAALLELLPGAQLYLGGNADTSKYLFNNNWLSYGAKASWNLMKLFQYPARKEVIDAQDRLLDQRALAVTMAVMTQVHVARVRYLHSVRELRTAADYLNVQNDILAQVRAQAKAERVGEQPVIREEMNALLAEVKFDLAHAQVQNALALIYSSTGLDPIDPTVDLTADVAPLSKSLSRLWEARGKSLGARPVSLLRAPRHPKPLPQAPMGEWSQTPTDGASGSLKLAPPAPAPGARSRSIGGTFLPPEQSGTGAVGAAPTKP
jgi:outer membrane protein TolC